MYIFKLCSSLCLNLILITAKSLIASKHEQYTVVAATGSVLETTWKTTTQVQQRYVGVSGLCGEILGELIACMWLFMRKSARTVSMCSGHVDTDSYSDKQSGKLEL